MCNKDCQQTILLYFEFLKIFSYFYWYFVNLSLLRINAAAPFEAVTRCHLVLVLHSFQIWGSKGQIHLFVLLLFLKYGQSVFSSKQLDFFFHFATHSQLWPRCFSKTADFFVVRHHAKKSSLGSLWLQMPHFFSLLLWLCILFSRWKKDIKETQETTFEL